MGKQILLLIDYNQTYQDKIQSIAPDYELVTDLNSADMSKVEIVIGWDKDLVSVITSKDHGIKWIQLQSAGADYIPQEDLKEQGIVLTTSSGMHSQVITETIMGMILGYYRRLFAAQTYQQAGVWGQDDLKLSSLEGKTVTIVGIGKIGQRTAELAKAFGMRTIGVNRSGRVVESVDVIYTQYNINQALEDADVVVNILPLTKETRALFNADLFETFKDQSIFINVGRGPSVVEADLLKALDSGKLAFAALDVFEEEPLPKSSPLWQHEKVLVTPHNAGFMDDYIGSLFPIIEENLTAYVNDGQPAINQIDYEKAY